jgi:hypothetical protein
MEDKIDISFNLRLANIYIYDGERFNQPNLFTVADGYLYDARLECEDATELDAIVELKVRLQEARIRSKLNGDNVESKVSSGEARIKANL